MTKSKILASKALTRFIYGAIVVAKGDPGEPQGMLRSQLSPVVLVVEDDASLRNLLCEALKTEGFSTCVASNGRDALLQFYQRLPDLVVLDLIMPEMDGWETLERLRMVSSCPVIIVTGLGTPEDIIRGFLEGGADDYLVKPFGIRELVARVHAVLRRSGQIIRWC